MIKQISIKLNQSLICGGLAILERDGEQICVDFDVVKTHPIQVIVGSRGKKIKVEDADVYEAELLDLFLKHSVPMKLGTFAIPA